MSLEQINDINALKENATLLHDEDTILQALNRLKQQLEHDYHNKNPIFLVVMNGGLIFAGNLLAKLNFPLQIDYCHATRYRGEFSGSEVQWKVKNQLDLSNRHVVIVDDILDEGHTLNAIIQDCISQQAISVKTLVLIEKLHNRKAVNNMQPDYCQLTTPDKYIFGYGMDINHYWRNTNAIYIYQQDN
jgi:hypoxanthine phosphoribosyltransferase